MLNAETVKSSAKRPSRMTGTEIRLARTDAEREGVYRFRYRVYVEEMGRSQKYADHVRRQIREPADETALILAAFYADEVVGTCRLNFARDGYYDHGEFYRLGAFESVFPGKVSFSTKIMVDKTFRRTPVFLNLGKETVRLALQHRCKLMLVDCNDPVLPLFQKLGFIAYDRTSHPEYGDVTLMGLFLEDFSHIQRITSPFQPVFEEFSHLYSGGSK